MRTRKRKKEKRRRGRGLVLDFNSLCIIKRLGFLSKNWRCYALCWSIFWCMPLFVQKEPFDFIRTRISKTKRKRTIPVDYGSCSTDSSHHQETVHSRCKPHDCYDLGHQQLCFANCPKLARHSFAPKSFVYALCTHAPSQKKKKKPRNKQSGCGISSSSACIMQQM